MKLLNLTAAACLLTSTVAPVALAQSSQIKEADACGFVVDASGSVVPDATVKGMSGEKTVATATSFSDGSFHFEESINSQIVVTVTARGFAPASETIDRVKGTKSEKKCKRPIYVVLTPGNGMSFITTKKNRVPRTAR
jgi:hypothetical protein